MNEIKMEREQIIVALKARLPWAREYDRERLAEHRKSELAWRAEIQRRAREVAKMSYAALVKDANDYRRGVLNLLHDLDTPSCPRSYTKDIKRAINDLEMTTQKSFTLNTSREAMPGVYHLLTFDPDEKGMCDA